ncbi:hypothetical protein [Deinococcus roseus]|uniref:Uncharacterized protein n=1 Tax=Deinococcus roseus TaxID=392414 RepID=A0ABQ2CW16_9DEIO|nr:hypothetical protein [Deinococcus roseus]GGJ26130.1 hypothetical protein GCM10008938_10350 [Deinococcus roseus]
MGHSSRKPTESRKSFILHVKQQGDLLIFVLQDLRSGERKEFTSWDSLGVHLEESMVFRLR